MATVLHEILVELFTETCALTDFLRATDKPSPRLVPTNPNISEIKPLELRADGLFLAGPPKRPKAWTLLEVQTSIDRYKLDTIPLSFEMAQRRYPKARGDVVLVTAKESVARFFDSHPFSVRGPLGTKRTLEVVRRDLSRTKPMKLLDPRHPHLSLLAVAASGNGTETDARRVAWRAVNLAVTESEPWRARLVDAILELVGSKIRSEMERKMERHGGYRSEFFRNAFGQGFSQGKAEGKAEGITKGKAEGQAAALQSALLRIISKRGFVLSAELRKRIAAEHNITRLERWLDVMITARSIADVFTDA